MPLEIIGTITKIAAIERVPKKDGTDLVKQLFTISSGDKYPQTIAFILFNDKTELLKPFPQGATVKVSFEPSSREYNGKYYTDLRAWRIEAAVAGQTVQSAPPQSNNFNDAPPPAWENTYNNSSVPDDLPF